MHFGMFSISVSRLLVLYGHNHPKVSSQHKKTKIMRVICDESCVLIGKLKTSQVRVVCAYGSYEQ